MSYVRALPNVQKGATAIASSTRRVGRMDISGKNLLDENGQKFVARGFNYGHGELWQTWDPVADKAMGANSVRILSRAWGGGHGGNSYAAPTLDGQDPSAFGNYTTDYLYYLKAQLTAAKLAGLKTFLGLDSNCGQNGNQDAPTQGYCSLFDGAAWQPGQSFFTTLGAAQQLPLHVNRARIIARVCRGLIDVMEPLVEPNAVIVGKTQADTNAIYRQVMTAVLQEDPDMIFMIGGNTYQHGKITDPVDGLSWPTNRLILTCDLLDNIMSDAVNYPAAVADMVNGRNTTGVPVLCNQAGTALSSEVGPIGGASDSLLLASGLQQLTAASGGSIGFLVWEKVSRNTGSYGGWIDPTTNPAGTGRVINSQNRINTLTTEFQRAVTPP